jgi:hypothetical protein
MLELTILNGKQQGDNKALFEGFKMGHSKDCNLIFDEPEFRGNFYYVLSSKKGVLSLSSGNRKPLINSGVGYVAQIELVPGIIFSIGNVGFSIQERSDRKKSMTAEKQADLLRELFQTQKPKEIQPMSFKTASSTVKISFVRGFWINKEWQVPWTPFSIGNTSSYYFFNDPLIPSDKSFLSFEEGVGKKFNLKSKIPGFVKANGKLIGESHELCDGDLIEFGQTAFYIVLK